MFKREKKTDVLLQIVVCLSPRLFEISEMRILKVQKIENEKQSGCFSEQKTRDLFHLDFIPLMCFRFVQTIPQPLTTFDSTTFHPTLILHISGDARVQIKSAQKVG